MKVLLLGCGEKWSRKIYNKGEPSDFSGCDLTTIDMDPSSSPHILMDLNDHPLPFDDSTFDELHAYDVLEHLGRQGDWKGYFDEFSEYHRLLKPGGLFHITVPVGKDAFADPGHTRFFSSVWFGFLSQSFYDEDVFGVATDYRWYWKKDFSIEFYNQSDHHIAVILKKI